MSHPTWTARLMTPCEAAWMAGIVDGEGTITVRSKAYPGGKHYQVAGISVPNTDVAMIARLVECTGIGRGAPDRAAEPQAEARLALAFGPTLGGGHRPSDPALADHEARARPPAPRDAGAAPLRQVPARPAGAPARDHRGAARAEPAWGQRRPGGRNAASSGAFGCAWMSLRAGR